MSVRPAGLPSRIQELFQAIHPLAVIRQTLNLLADLKPILRKYRFCIHESICQINRCQPGQHPKGVGQEQDHHGVRRPWTPGCGWPKLRPTQDPAAGQGCVGAAFVGHPTWVIRLQSEAAAFEPPGQTAQRRRRKVIDTLRRRQCVPQGVSHHIATHARRQACLRQPQLSGGQEACGVVRRDRGECGHPEILRRPAQHEAPCVAVSLSFNTPP